MAATRARSLAKYAVIEGVNRQVVREPANLTEVGALVAIEEDVAVCLGEGADGKAVALDEVADAAVVAVTGLPGDTVVVIVRPLHRHTEDERLGAKLFEPSHQQLEIRP